MNRMIIYLLPLPLLKGSEVEKYYTSSLVPELITPPSISVSPTPHTYQEGIIANLDSNRMGERDILQ